MKLAKLFAEHGAAAVHLEDQLHGGKKCGHLSGKVLVPMSEHTKRLVAARLQWDMMGTENLLIARTDSQSGNLISSTVDSRDHEFILGVMLDEGEAEPLAETLQVMEREGALPTEIDAFEADWIRAHRLVTFDEGTSSAWSSCFTSTLMQAGHHSCQRPFQNPGNVTSHSTRILPPSEREPRYTFIPKANIS